MSRNQRFQFGSRRVLSRGHQRSRRLVGRRQGSGIRSHQYETLEDRHLLAFDAPLLNFEGQSPSASLAPPDPVGYVGKDHYIQMVNSAAGSNFTIYDKETGNIQLGPIATSSLAPANTACSQFAGGDPIVVYDQLADRWVLMEFLAPSFFTGGPDGICFYVSQTSDPTDNLWHDYYFETVNFADYPKLNVSPSAYVVTANDIDLNLFVNIPAAYAFDRERMLQGAPALAVRPPVRVAVGALEGFTFQGLAGSDLDGPAPADPNTSFLMRHRDDELHGGEPVTIDDVTLPYDPENDFLEMWEFEVDFDNGIAALNELPPIPIAEFDSNLCDLQRSCLPQPLRPDGTQPPGLDPISQIIMHRLQYRSFGTYETLVGNFTVDSNSRDQAGIRWFELRREPGDDWELYQEGIVSAEDQISRFMGSIAMDGDGNIALGYTATGRQLHPSLRYTGRLATDPLGTMPQGEHEIVRGSGSQLGFDRWGDYSAMTVDPIDDSTFFFTGEYVNGVRWATRIAAMSFDDPRPVLPTGPGREVSGVAWDDRDGDGIQDPGEPRLAGWTIYLDLNNDGRRGIAEPSAVTNEQGVYRFRDVTPGTYTVREIVQPSWVQTYPRTNNGGHVVQVFTENGPNDADFGNRLGSGSNVGTDYGDAPAPFPTRLSQNGASHTIVPGFGLGARIDGEADGQPNLTATGDDLVGDDEDGVVLLSDLIPGGRAQVQVDVRYGTKPPGLLQAWIDFDRDGAWNTPGEQIFRNLNLTEGANTLTFQVPSWAVLGETYARFRYGYESGLSFTGSSVAGEVEDYLVEVVRGGPTANDDIFSVRRNSEENELEVLANDIVRPGTGTTIVSVSSPNRGGTVRIAPDRLSLFYTPAEGFDGTETFIYTLQDQDGVTDSASVQVIVPPDLVALRLRATTEDGTPLTEVAVGEEFLLNGYVQDLRKTGATGVFAAYLDVQYPSAAATVTGPIIFGDDYENGRSGSTDQPGLIDEVGAFDGLTQLGPNELLLFSVRVEASAEGNLTFTPNPADQVPLHNVLLFDRQDPVPFDRIEYAPLTIVVGANVTNLQTNPRNAFDVNDDFSVSPIDALLVINELNVSANGQAARDAEATASVYLDVSADGVLSPLDALLVINELNRSTSPFQNLPLNAVAAALAEGPAGEAVSTPDADELPTMADSVVVAIDLTDSSHGDSLFSDAETSLTETGLADDIAGESLDEILGLIGDDVARESR